MRRSIRLVLTLVALTMALSVVPALARTEIEVWFSDFTADTQRFIEEKLMSAIHTDYVRDNEYVRRAIEIVMPYGIVNPTSAAGANSAVAAALRKMYTDGWTAQQALETAAAQWVPFSN
jgi:protein involved in ribonucleotide reduction